LHELSLTQRIVHIVLKEAKNESASRVLKVTLAVGEDSGIMPDCVQNYYDLLTEGTIAYGAKIEANSIRSTLYCENCKKEFERARFSFTCSDCGAEGTPTGKGSECYVESIEIDI
jgi:hydrogenase nickel incorporation protein HypA/HybF